MAAAFWLQVSSSLGAIIATAFTLANLLFFAVAASTEVGLFSHPVQSSRHPATPELFPACENAGGDRLGVQCLAAARQTGNLGFLRPCHTSR
eukprot:CAMPEP_0178383646 /NCGR_PEP_ID=MMETSP0689_2-20121128/7107_1 /TAXON_ID=160604 /ORGANISM="Amphidinium massartii, Strain CS-259" /LENGTH=91 /DNA_ID=CAMNT_0020003869 /DNA_START=189 /DNA_END=464 /DNA_ORIENTATION=-